MKILLVEDDINLAVGIEYALKSEGFEALIAHSVSDARQKLNTPFDLILLDCMLPDGTGYELCKYIRDKLKIPVIFLTACDDEANIVMGLDLGADDYITKPVRVKELISRIKAVMRRVGDKQAASTKLLHSGNILINTAEYKVKKDNQDIILTSLEYKLLLTLINSPHTVITRNRLLEILWDIEGNFVDDNALSVYIRRLREKIEDNPDSPIFVKTIRGTGYKWDMEVTDK